MSPAEGTGDGLERPGQSPIHPDGFPGGHSVRMGGGGGGTGAPCGNKWEKGKAVVTENVHNLGEKG